MKLLLKFHCLIAVVRISAGKYHVSPKFTVVIYGYALYPKITLCMVNVRYRTKQHTIEKADIPKKRPTVIIMTYNDHKISWLVVSTTPKNMKVKWDYYSQYMEKINMFQTTNQIIVMTIKLVVQSVVQDPMLCPVLPAASRNHK